MGGVSALVRPQSSQPLAPCEDNERNLLSVNQEGAPPDPAGAMILDFHLPEP